MKLPHSLVLVAVLAVASVHLADIAMYIILGGVLLVVVVSIGNEIT